MRKLKVLGLREEGLKIFYIGNIRSVITFATPAWYVLTNQRKLKLQAIEITAASHILPECE